MQTQENEETTEEGKGGEAEGKGESGMRGRQERQGTGERGEGRGGGSAKRGAAQCAKTTQLQGRK